MPSLTRASVNIPGLSDHDAIITDSCIGPCRTQQKPRKRFHFGKANWDGLRTAASKLSGKLLKMYESANDIESLWTAFKDDLLAAANQHIPSTSSTPRHHLPWLNHHLKKLLKKKKRLYKQATRAQNWTNYKLIQKACKQAFRKDGFSNNNPKPFWRYIKKNFFNKTTLE